MGLGGRLAREAPTLCPYWEVSAQSEVLGSAESACWCSEAAGALGQPGSGAALSRGLAGHKGSPSAWPADTQLSLRGGGPGWDPLAMAPLHREISLPGQGLHALTGWLEPARGLGSH